MKDFKIGDDVLLKKFLEKVLWIKVPLLAVSYGVRLLIIITK